jgi:hypothetical protein
MCYRTATKTAKDVTEHRRSAENTTTQGQQENPRPVHVEDDAVKAQSGAKTIFHRLFASSSQVKVPAQRDDANGERIQDEKREVEQQH